MFSVLPLHYITIVLVVPHHGFEPCLPDYKTGVHS
jgi:hypothetical protein